MKLRVILIISMILPANAVFVHRLCVQCGCSNSVNETEFFVSLNQNEVLFGDFKAQKQINRLPLFVSQISVPDLYDEAVGCKDICLQKIPNVIAAAGSPAEVRVPPEFSIYTRHHVVPGEKNNFVCFIRNFYPPHITVNWTRNGVSVTEGVYISQYALNNDGTFNSFSTLTSTPRVGDEYSCTVEHEALDSPQIRTWDESVEPPSETPSETPTVVLAVGIVVGILGLATGMFFVIKASCFR
ncbi:hypothetical protein KOW79_003763 [Hemibagrus wyckioides]|uniref:Ig-like domain-containing protein n=1 Tax=Hemibagrus wyckioides TaxID=337641 RepID=A0A9D3P0J3_9TELE|nr:rano class II histocompatibility antigen, B alpha chain-like isoform X1 [Hemibagrus wyckioides]KAG7331929.1 hypothetical protein KOW79_003763 [Hemibagrus wyckioides]